MRIFSNRRRSSDPGPGVHCEYFPSTIQRIVVIPRTSKIKRLAENATIFDFTLSEEEMAAIAALARRDGRIVDFAYSGRPHWD